MNYNDYIHMIMSGLSNSGKLSIAMTIMNIDNKWDVPTWDRWFLTRYYYHDIFKTVFWNADKNHRPDRFLSNKTKLFYYNEEQQQRKYRILIWVMDSSDQDRICYNPANDIENKENFNNNDEFYGLINAIEMENVVRRIVLVVLNKWDLNHGMSRHEILQKMGMFEYEKIDVHVLESVLSDIPIEILNIIVDYAEHEIFDPHWNKTIKCDDIFCLNTGFNWKICQIICAFLPPYESISCKEKTTFKIIESSINDRHINIIKGYEWIKQIISD